jgi:hypothetical protein
MDTASELHGIGPPLGGPPLGGATLGGALILGRFSVPERKAVLDALRDELRKSGRGYVPVVFDFEKPRRPIS